MNQTDKQFPDIHRQRRRPRSKGSEDSLYMLLRVVVAGVGLLVILGTYSAHFTMPELFYDEAPGPPPLRDQFPTIILSFGIGALLMTPHRWTRRAWLFWPRLTIYTLIAVFLTFTAYSGILAGLDGGRSWHIYPVSVFAGLFGVALPLCLLWSRRLQRMTAPSLSDVESPVETETIPT